MKTRIAFPRRRSDGYALLMVLVMGAVAVLILSATLSRTNSVAMLNSRNNQYTVNLNAAEAAVEKVVARLAYDFAAYGPGAVYINKNAGIYATNIPTESAYFSQFEFTDGRGNANRTYVEKIGNYTGPLPSQYPGLTAVNAPLYRVLSNVRVKTGPNSTMTNAVQADILLGLVPLTQYAIFYNGLLEFSTCATMTVNGRTHANNNIYVGSGETLTFNGTVTAAGVIASPANNGGGPWYPSKSPNWNVKFKGNPTYKTNVPTITLSINMTNTHSMIDMPPPTEDPNSLQGYQRLYNQAHTVLLVSNDMVTLRIQNAGPNQIPGVDTSPITLTSSNNVAALSTNFPFLVTTNQFLDQREDKTIVVSQIDVGRYAQWIRTNTSITTKFPAGSGTAPTILYVADNRTTMSSQLTAVRLTNGIAPPSNGGLGWSVATPNPLYVLGNYNCTNASYLASTNTSATVPCALISDALTLLSESWRDSTSFTVSQTGPNASANNTVNAAILTGVKPSTGNTSATFSGGVHNLPRLLENWGSSTLWLNTSIINLYNSTKATGQFVTPGTGSYYVPPTRKFSFDLNFLDYNRVPPGIPSGLVAIRKNWAVPPANTLTYNVTYD